MARWMDRMAVAGAVVGGTLLSVTGVLMLLAGLRVGISPWALIGAGVALVGGSALAARRRGWDGCEVAAAGAVAGLAAGVAIAAVGAVAAKAVAHRLLAVLAGAAVAAAVLAGGHWAGAVVAVGSVALTGRDITLAGGTAGGTSPRGPPSHGARLPGRTPRPASQPDYGDALALARAARQAAAPVTTAQPLKRHRAIATPHKTIRGDLLYARRADVWAPQPTEAVRTATGSDGQPLAEVATTLCYRDTEEGTILFTLPGDGPAPRLGVWEQYSLYVICDRFVRLGAPADDTIHWPSMRVLARAVLGREPRGQDNDRIERALRTLATTIVLQGSADLAVQVDRKGRSHVVRSESDDIYTLIQSLHIERKGRAAPSAAGQPRKLRAREISMQLPSVITARLRAGVVATMRASVVHSIGLRDEATLRLYAHLCSQRFPVGRVSQEVVYQIVRPTASWGPRAHPAKFRQRVERMLEALRSDQRFTVAFDSREGGGWNILWERTDRKKQSRQRQ